ncbi:MAG: phosphoglucomutase/phosphomannomutase family protein [Bacteroidetes bacterium]|nr:MAG: phosphoglucomutase/phosphomannomutase family protein [Bacteroidota bacterium]
MSNYKIKFGTDGWRAIIARDFTVENVSRVGAGIANWLKEEVDPKVVIGFDTRFGGILFAESLSIVLLKRGIKVFLDKQFVTTPMVSYAVKSLKCDLGVIFTASHNPPSYNGFKIKASYGGPATDDIVNEIVGLIPNEIDMPANEDYNNLKSHPDYKTVNLETMYFKNLNRRFSLDKLMKYQRDYVFDAMNGSIQEFIQKLFPEMKMVRVDPDPTFKGTSPEPIEKNLEPLKLALKRGDFELGLAVDGDADRIGLMDRNGNVIDAHHIMLILIWYLNKYKGQTGKVVTGFSSTQKIKSLCKKLGLDLKIVKIGFKHSAAVMLKEDVLVAGEEAGGIATKGYIPERDGLWNILIILEMLIENNITIEEVLKEIEDEVGKFDYVRSDLHIERSKIDEVIDGLKNELPTEIGGRKIAYTETLDGFKFYFNDDEWLMIRASGTEPLLRVYAESTDKTKAGKLVELGIEHFDLL